MSLILVYMCAHTGGAVQVADGRSIRVVHVLASPHRAAVSFGSRGGCRREGGVSRSGEGELRGAARASICGANFGGGEVQKTNRCRHLLRLEPELCLLDTYNRKIKK